MSKFSINGFDTLARFLQLQEGDRARLTEVSFESPDDWFPILSTDPQKFKAFYDSLLQCSALQKISESDSSRKSLLWLAAYYEQWDLINTLLQYAKQGKYRLNIDFGPVEGPNLGTTPLWWSVYPGPIETIELLLLNGADINAIPIEGQHGWKTPFWRAAQYRRWDVVKLMMEHAEQKDYYVSLNASPSEGQDKGTTPLWWAAYDKQWDLVALMMKHASQKGSYLNFDAAPTEGEHKGKTVFSLMSTCVDELDLEALSLITEKTPENPHKLDVTVDPATRPKSLQDHDSSERSLLLPNPEEEGKKLLLGFELRKDITKAKTVSPHSQPILQRVSKKGRKSRYRQSASIHVTVA